MRKSVVFDTNVLISGYLWKGKPRQAIQIVKSGVFNLLYCTDSLNELVRILASKFGLTSGEIYRVVLDIQGSGKRVEVTSRETPIKEDSSDNLFVNLAMDGHARIIVSGDSHLLNLKEHKKIEIITVADFVKRYS
ncbi:MAG: putative toxin-antitoxin system toxin component, PIN family [Nitrospinae bacterium]|nr:putative toxin-antitoxin system toxin component, PIN family [Nitrospinota bacterium]